MNSFDLAILHFLNSFAQSRPGFDLLVVRVMEDGLTAGAVVVALFWAAWETEGKGDREKEEILLFGLFASIFSVLVARALALTLPFRARPLHNPEIHFHVPNAVEPSRLIDWSSFPSDHATLFFCLATILWMVSRRLGIIAVLYALVVIDLPRVYTGIHYPTDIIAGSVLGFAIASGARVPRLRSAIANPALRWKGSYPTFFHFCFFLWAFEVGELFTTVRDFAYYALHVWGLESLLRR